MSQISLPLRILLAGSILFVAAYMMFLRPGGTDTAAPPAPAATPAAASTPASAPGAVVEGARDAAAGAEAAAAASAGEAPVTGTAPQTAAPATSAPGGTPATKAKVDTKGLPADVAKAVEAGKVLVLLFWNPEAADDRAVRQELREVDRYDGRVAVHVADVDRIARYARIAQGVEVEQSPSIVVIDGERRASLLTGYADAASIEQLVVDALGLDALIAEQPVDAYFRSVDRLCEQARGKLSFRNVDTPAQFATLVAQAAAVSATHDKRFRALDTPKRHRAFRSSFAAHNAKGTRFLAAAAVDARAAKTGADVQAIAKRIARRASTARATGVERYGRYGIASCL